MGAPRSGTTLAAQLLDGHTRLAVYLEMTYYGTFGPIIRLYGDLSREANRRRFLADVFDLIRLQRAEPPTIAVVEEALLEPTFEGILTTLLELHARQRGKVRGGEKTPLNLLYLDQILAGFPTSPVLYLMRDPRDVVLSMRKTWNTPIREAVEVWNSALERYEERASDVHLVRYEQLVHQPAATAAEMCRAIAEPFEPEMLRHERGVSDQLKGIRHLNLAKLNGPVVSSSVGNFKQMSAQDIRAIETACAAGMERMGYELASSHRPVRTAQAPTLRRRRFVRLVIDRLRYYGVNRERWRRGMFRWRISTRARLRHGVLSCFRRVGLLSSVVTWPVGDALVF